MKMPLLAVVRVFLSRPDVSAVVTTPIVESDALVREVQRRCADGVAGGAGARCTDRRVRALKPCGTRHDFRFLHQSGGSDQGSGSLSSPRSPCGWFERVL